MANINILFIHLAWWILKFDVRIYTAVLFGFSLCPWLVIYGYSIKHYFCKWHRVLLINILIHGILSAVNMYLFYFKYEILPIFYVTLFLNAIAIVAATILYRKDGCFTTTHKRFVKNDRRAKMWGIQSDELGFAKRIQIFCNAVFHNLHKNSRG